MYATLYFENLKWEISSTQFPFDLQKRHAIQMKATDIVFFENQFRKFE